MPREVPDVTPKTESPVADDVILKLTGITGRAEARVLIDQVRREAASKAVAEAEARDIAMMAALADVTAAYHHERRHEGKWTACQHPRCQNARLATENRGPFALIASERKP